MDETNNLKKISEYQYEIEKKDDMNVPGLIFANEQIINSVDNRVIEQLTNVTKLPGIQKKAFAMPDTHLGYGFPIGGVGAFDPNENGVISVGGIGFDINCGVRTLITNLKYNEIKPHLQNIADILYRDIPAGVGKRGKLTLGGKDINEVMIKGSKFLLEKGFATKEDIENTEDNGCVKGAKPEFISQTAIKRENKQIGTLGSGNHYLEIQQVSDIYDENTSKAFGLSKDQILFTLHCGSRALGHQIGTDYIQKFTNEKSKFNFHVKDRQLVSAPINSDVGQQYYGAMVCATNYAFANRQMITNIIRESMNKIIPDMELKLLYDVGHNTCKIEKHKVDNKIKELYVHRKGATRAFAPNRDELPSQYKKYGQPVIIGGSMGTHSYILAGEKNNEAFESVCHGAGRSMSRTQAMKTWTGQSLINDLKNKGIIIKGHSLKGLSEEAPGAYKDVNNVIDVIQNAKLSRKVIRMKPLVSIKG